MGFRVHFLVALHHKEISLCYFLLAAVLGMTIIVKAAAVSDVWIVT
jgi:hypothetical protein